MPSIMKVSKMNKDVFKDRGEGKVKSAYIHIPFCDNICSYCDFCKFIKNDKWVDDYLEALKKEVFASYKGEELETLYIGGGTPSSLNLDELNKLFEIVSVLKLKKDAEFTFECNVLDIDLAKMQFLFTHGVNRLSIGVETFNPKFLSILNRQGDSNIEAKIKLLKKIGFTNINIDLIYGLPKQTLTDLKKDLANFLALDVPHISTYSLMIEPNTLLYIKKTPNISTDLDAKFYQTIKETLISNGYEHYEISNFAKKGYQSMHNLTYWLNNNYYGFGLGASGFIGNVRYQNRRNLNKYLAGDYILEKETLTTNMDIENTLILGLRMTKGISLVDFSSRYQKNLLDYDIIKKLLANKSLKCQAGRLFINDEYLYIENQILVQLMGEKYE